LIQKFQVSTPMKTGVAEPPKVANDSGDVKW
jgi:hypothetical protein